MRHVLKDLQATQGLRLRVSAQVMLLANLDVTQGLVNGSRGVVVEFVSMKEAIEAVRIQSALRNSTQDDEAKGIGDLMTFAGKNDKMQFPKVLFELKNGTKEVSQPRLSYLLIIDYYNAIYMDDAPRSPTRSLESSDSVDDCMGIDDT